MIYGDFANDILKTNNIGVYSNKPNSNNYGGQSGVKGLINGLKQIIIQIFLKKDLNNYHIQSIINIRHHI